jgi:hypothetical protein
MHLRGFKHLTLTVGPAGRFRCGVSLAGRLKICEPRGRTLWLLGLSITAGFDGEPLCRQPGRVALHRRFDDFDR